MDSDALNTFLTVHRRGGVSNAAKVLHRSQPAISRRIALLEQELGVPLFERVAGRTRLSDAGRVMVPYAERAVAAAQDAENAVRALTQPNAGPVSLAVVGTLAGGRLSADPEALRPRISRRRSDVAYGDQRRGQRSDPARRGDDRLALRIGTARAISTMSGSRPSRCRWSARPIIRWPASAWRGWPICAASAGSHFPRSRAAAKSRPRTSSRCFWPMGSAKSPGRRSTA